MSLVAALCELQSLVRPLVALAAGQLDIPEFASLDGTDPAASLMATERVVGQLRAAADKLARELAPALAQLNAAHAAKRVNEPIISTAGPPARIFTTMDGRHGRLACVRARDVPAGHALAGLLPADDLF